MQTSPELLDREATTLANALGSQYDLVRLIGRGGMGRVYLAHERFLDRDVAVKVLPAEFAEGSEARDRFLREARTAARLSHANIVPLYTFGESGDLLYFIMGYVAGESLETRLQREGRLPVEDTRRLIAEIADALDYAHTSGVVHRDLKPDNILIDGATGRAMLADFGIAKGLSAESLTRTGMLLGTPHYMSPEQAAGDRTLDGRSDLYSLGVVAYRMITGRLPFVSERIQEILSQHMTQAPRPIVHLAADTPLEMVTVIERALQKDPVERWPSGRVMRDALTGDGDEGVPDGLRPLLDLGVRMLGIMLVMWGIAFAGLLYGFLDPLAVVVVALLGLAVPPVAIAGSWRGPFTPRARLNAMFRQPGWWKGWWPAFGRRAGDVWDRLPPAIRRTRAAGSWTMLVNIPVLGLMLWYARPEHFVSLPSWAGFVPTLLMAPFIGVVAAVSLKFRSWRKRLGLGDVDASRLLSESTFKRAFWERPDIVALLRPNTRAARSETPALDTPDAMVRELSRRAASELAESPHAALYTDAVQAAQRIRAAVAELDREMVKLAAQINSADRANLEGRMRGMGPAEQDESAEMREMRNLLARQLGLITALELRSKELSERRLRLVDHLRLLVLEVAQLAAAAGSLGAQGDDITARVRSLCQRVDERAQGALVVQSILAGAETAPR